jgi:DNA-nicking Smr family endonuclease
MKKPVQRGGPTWFKPQATLDLHMLTVAEAQDALEDFIHASFMARKQTLLVLHGAKTLAPVVKRLLDRHSLVNSHEPDNSGATRVFLGKPR